jgi:hypothetical protein
VSLGSELDCLRESEKHATTLMIYQAMEGDKYNESIRSGYPWIVERLVTSGNSRCLLLSLVLLNIGKVITCTAHSGGLRARARIWLALSQRITGDW